MQRRIWPSDEFTVQLCKRLGLEASIADCADDAFGIDVRAHSRLTGESITWQGKQDRSLVLQPGIRQSNAIIFILSEAKQLGAKQRASWLQHPLQADWLALWSRDNSALCWSRQTWEMNRAAWLQNCRSGELRPRAEYGERTGLFVPLSEANADLLVTPTALKVRQAARDTFPWLRGRTVVHKKKRARPRALPPSEDNTDPLPGHRKITFAKKRNRITDLQVIEDWDLPYHLGRAIEAIYESTRYQESTDPLMALRRARQCIDRLIQAELHHRTGEDYGDK